VMMDGPSPDLAIVVWGTPGTAGSKRPFAIYKGKGADRQFTGRIAMTDDAARRPSSPGATWRQAVVEAAREVVGCKCPDPGCSDLATGYPLEGPLEIAMVFTRTKPGTSPKRKRSWPIARPDVTKNARVTEDALTDAGVWRDDAQVWNYRRLAKVYPGEDEMALPTPGAVIYIWRTRVESPTVAAAPNVATEALW